MFKRIVAATDGSSTSKRALRAALALAGEQRAELCIVHAVDLVYLGAETPYDLSEFEDSARKSAERVLQQAVATARKQGIEPDAKLLEVRQVGDRVADVLARFSKRWKADLIVIGTHGRRGISHLFLGSVAESVLRSATTPVLLIRGR